MRFARVALGLSSLLFVTSVWFVLSASRGPSGPVAAPPVATVRQLMVGLVIPASSTIYESAGTISTMEGTIEKAPKTDKDWYTVGAAATMLIEASSLLESDGRAVADPEWAAAADEMAAGARSVIGAVEAKNVDALLDKGGEIVAACDRCHQKFMPNIR